MRVNVSCLFTLLNMLLQRAVGVKQHTRTLKTLLDVSGSFSLQQRTLHSSWFPRYPRAVIMQRAERCIHPVHCIVPTHHISVICNVILRVIVVIFYVSVFAK